MPSEVADEPQIEQAVALGNGLVVHVISHGYPDRKVALWSLISEGMSAHGQREIVFSLMRRAGERAEDVPKQLLVMLRQIHKLAQQGQHVVWGGMTELGEDLLAPRLRGVVYADAQPIPGVRIPDNALTAILVDSDELTLVKRFGLYRLLARLGKQHSHFPFPPWTDRERVAHANDPKTLLSMFGAKISFPPASLALEGKRVALQLLRDDGAELAKLLAQVPAGMPFVIMTRPERNAHAWLVWAPGQTEPEAITGPTPSSTSITGGFLACVIGANKPEQLEQMEDGFTLMLSALSWTRFTQALADGQPFTLPPSTASDLAFELCWIEQTLHSVVDGKRRHAEGGWHRYTPHADPHAADASAREITLLSSERELRTAIAVDQLVDYIKQIYTRLDELAPPSIARTTVTLHIELAPGAAPGVQLVAEPALAFASDVREAVAALAPRVNGPLAFEIAIKLGSDA